MNICMITFQYPPMINGGVGSAVYRIAKNLTGAGVNVHIVAPGNRNLEMPITPVQEEGVTVHRTFPGLGNYYGDSEELRNIGYYVMQLHDEVGFDLLHGVFLVPSGLVASIVSRQTGLPTIQSIRGGDVELMRFNPVLCGTVRSVLEQASLVTSVTSELLNKAKQITNIRWSCTIPNAFDANVFDHSPIQKIAEKQGLRCRLFVEKLLREKSKGSLIIGTAGIIRYVKGFHVLIKACKNILEAGAQFRLLILGDFIDLKEAKKWRKQIKKMGLKKHVWFTGRMPHRQIIAWMQMMDIFAFPSLHEGSPNALLEAMACGLPVVTSEVGGMLDIVTEGKDGLLVPPGQEDKLTAKLIMLIQDQALRKRLGEAAKQKITCQFTPEREAKTWIKIYRQVIHESRSKIVEPVRVVV